MFCCCACDHSVMLGKLLNAMGADVMLARAAPKLK
jgi:hypothetical protein